MFDLHIHSIYSDGACTVDEIARRAKERGMKVIAIVDHSLEHRRGMDEGKAKKRQSEIEEAKAKYNIEILSGIECGILPEGEIILPNFEFDLVVASIHDLLTVDEYYYRIEMCLKKFGDRVDVIGHLHSEMFGISGRDYVKDVELIDLLVETDTAIEINTTHMAPPLDFLELCSGRRIKYSIGSDAHTLEKVGNVKWGFEIARRYLKKGVPIINPKEISSSD